MAAGADSVSLRGDGGANVTLRGWPGWSFHVATGGAVTVTPAEGEALTAVLWRAIPIGHVLAQARDVRRGDDLAALLRMLAADGDEPASPRRSPQLHRQKVAEVYRLALQHDVSPEKAIKEAFHTSEVTARRWIASIRRTPENPSGLIDDHATEKARAQTYEPHRPTGRGNGRSPGRGSTARKDNSK